MPQIINTNISSLNAQRNLNSSQSANRTSLERLSSGLRINSAKDDAAGLAISTRFTSQIKGLSVAIRNAGDGISLAQTAEGALSSMTSNLQRIRELALQSSNATNSDVDREALNAEAQQLISEITRSGEQANFNGTNLLDGNFNASFQIGANRGETVTFGIAELTSSSLGGARSAGISAQGTDSALGNGDLVINGAVVGASVASSDTSSVADQEKSAIAKVAAINAVSDESGVVATVDTNTVAGSIQVAAATSGSIELNGVTIAVATGGVDATADRQSVVAAINARSGETGVIATDEGTLEGGVTLAAADGRNITLGTFDTVTSAATGLAAADTTYTGGFTLTSQESGTPVVLAEGTGDITSAGLAAGTFTANTSSMTTTSRTGAAYDAISSLAAGDMEINSVSIGASRDADDTSSNAVADSSTLAGSGISIAAAINRSTEVTGVTATVNATVVSGGTATTAATGTSIGAAGDIYINNINVGTVTLTGDSEQDRGTAIDLINSKSGQTGVVATDSGGAIDLTAADGRNISVAIDTKAAANIAALGASAAFAGANIGLSGASVGEADLSLGASMTGIADASGYGATGNLVFDLSLNGDTAKTITVGTGFTDEATFLTQLNAALDDATTGFGADTVTASVVGGKLTLTADGTGSAESLTISNVTDTAGALTFVSGLATLGTATLSTSSAAVSTYANSAMTTTSTIRLESSKAFTLEAGTNGESTTTNVAEGAVITGTASVSAAYTTTATDAGMVFSLSLDGAAAQTVTVTGTNTSANTEANFLTSLNAALTTTFTTAKVVASVVDDKLVLTTTDVNAGDGTGSNKSLAITSVTDGAGIFETLVTSGAVAIGKDAASVTTGLGSVGLKAGQFGGSETGQFLTDVDLTSVKGALNALDAIDNALQSVSSERANLGAIQNRLQSTIDNLSINVENLQAANSRILDADFAAETAELSRTQVLQQAGISILAQANAAPQQVLALLQ
jgi:flagellin